jgi:hypothetical protein
LSGRLPSKASSVLIDDENTPQLPYHIRLFLLNLDLSNTGDYFKILFYVTKRIIDWLTLNCTKHCLGQLAQLLEVTHLGSKKYPAELTPLNIFSQTEFMMHGTTYLALWLTLTLSLYLKND